MYRVIGTAKSRAFRVMWMLEELGQPYEVEPALPQTDDIRRYNPLGKIPALVDGDAVLTDSVAIMTYLADKHSGMTAPAGTPERARQDAMTLWLVDEMDALLWTAAKHSFVLPEKLRVPEVKPTVKAEFARNADRLAGMLRGDFLMGDVPSLPDILASHCLGWSLVAKFDPLPDSIKPYTKRLRERDAYKAAAAR
ncbi:glutathione S-transferase family protein [uncultured Tateyamaria sp.]|uniref:glutathione S-transferase family protein n=1 Tax=Tateyamaria sp. 1078 TaxID=3417464 RepID=UPI00262D4C83|nr:glutathione S-transferase [uncultured Tateyamaria sp.]